MRAYKPITSEESLLSFGIWYTERYIPSEKKLADILAKKCTNADWISSVLSKLAVYIDDQKNLASRLQSELERGSPVRSLTMKYVMKGFKKEDILSVLASLSIDSSGRKNALMKKFEKLIYTGKSKRVARMTMEMDFPELKEEISKLFETYPDDEVQLENSFSEWKGRDDKKTYENLVRKGFSYEAVRDFLKIDR